MAEYKYSRGWESICLNCGDIFILFSKYSKYCEECVRIKSDLKTEVYYRDCLYCDEEFMAPNKYVRRCKRCRENLDVQYGAVGTSGEGHKLCGR